MFGDNVLNEQGIRINPVAPTAKKEFKRVKRQITAKDTEFQRLEREFY